tara:strand:- start:72 stop:548 length:477 start_codon:yes stop_codon:yes gene_type:complete
MIEIAAEIDRDQLREVIRQEIDGFDLAALLGNKGDLDDSLDQRIEEVSDRLDNMPDVDDMKSDLDELEYKFDDKIPELEDAVERLRLEAHEQKEDWKAMLKGPTHVSPEVDAALRKQHQRIEELEHAMLCVFEYLHDLGQRDLARGIKRFDESLQGGE